MAPMSAQKRIELMCRSSMPRLGPSRSMNHEPSRYPSAIPTPWGEMAKSPPKWMRSTTGQPIAARTFTAPTLATGRAFHPSGRVRMPQSAPTAEGVMMRREGGDVPVPPRPEDQLDADHYRTLQRERRRRLIKLVVALAILVVLVIFIVTNSERVPVDFVFF